MGIADDVAVFGKYEKEHDANLHNLIKIMKQEGLVFNPDRCDIKGALYRIQILCRRYIFLSYPAELTIANPPG